MRRILACLLLLGVVGCGGDQKKMETDSIRDRADQADRDLDRESGKSEE